MNKKVVIIIFVIVFVLIGIVIILFYRGEPEGNPPTVTKVVDVFVQKEENLTFYIPQIDAPDAPRSRITGQRSLGSDRAAISNDRNRIVFDWSKNANDNSVWVMDLALKKAKIIHQTEIRGGKLYRIPIFLSWSPDDSQILMVAQSAGEGDNLYTITPEGGDLKQWTFYTKASGRQVRSPIWDKLGKKIYFFDVEGEKENTQSVFKVLDLEQGKESVLGQVKGTVMAIQAQTGPLAAFDWADNDKLVFLLNVTVKEHYISSAPSMDDLYVLDTSSGKVKQLTTTGQVINPPAVSPDGSRIAFFTEPEGAYYPVLLITDVSGSVKQRIDEFHEDYWNKARGAKLIWSLDGRKIALISNIMTEIVNERVKAIDLIIVSPTIGIEKNLIGSFVPDDILAWDTTGKIFLAAQSENQEESFFVYDGLAQP